MRDFACKYVWENEAPVLYVTHDHDDDWQLLCGGDEHDGADGCILLHKEHLAARDPSLRRVFDLEAGWEAQRFDIASPWERRSFAERDHAESDSPLDDDDASANRHASSERSLIAWVQKLWNAKIKNSRPG